MKRYLRQKEKKMLNLDRNKKYLLACSFGTDSMVLFNLLLQEGYDFSVAHVNYKLREESDFEEEELTKICNENNIQIYIHRVNEFLSKNNLEEKCRIIRYTFFKNVYDLHNFDALLVAHQQDDLIETFLLQKQRKSLVSYYGLKEIRTTFGMTIIRPLLHLCKNDISAYLSKNNIPYSVDKTNLENTYSRNKIRHGIVEKLSKEERLQILQNIEVLNEKFYKNLTKIQNLDIKNIHNLLKLDDEEFYLAIHLLLEKTYGYYPISKKLANSIKMILKSDKPNVVFPINSHISFAKEYDNVYFALPDENVTKYEYVLEVPGKLDTPYFQLDFTSDTSNRNVFEKDYPLVIRNAKPEDKFNIKDYQVSVRRAFIDWKMPITLRNKWPVIVNHLGQVVYDPRYSKNFKPKATDNFIVKISYKDKQN